MNTGWYRYVYTKEIGHAIKDCMIVGICGLSRCVRLPVFWGRFLRNSWKSIFNTQNNGLQTGDFEEKIKKIFGVNWYQLVSFGVNWYHP